MLVRCPHCSVAHVVARPPGNAHHARVRCEACGRAFAWFPALEIAPAGEPANGAGLQPVPAAENAPAQAASGRPDEGAPTLSHPTVGSPDTQSARSVPYPEPSTRPPAAPDPEPERERPARGAPGRPDGPQIRPARSAHRTRFGGAALASLLLLGLIFQLLAFPPRAITQEPALETLRTSLCERLHCPERAHRAPESVRVSTPSLHPAGAGSGRWLIFELYNRESRAQAWPLLDIALSDTLGRTHARERIHPRVYAPDGDPPPQMAAHRPWPVALRIHTEHPRLSGVHVRPR
ncbi:zinc-ribbon and DUF3426 domain-containing protein [Thioalkalivibrio sp. ALE23]|uniref:zinc-ribbon and DUF3426 domain-containing protein n=1 Tax=Thioalkalivibrio sp. ALE23 TaxID=1265495 RepID=UPI0004777B29|nr:zinc-ribbon and DUF3426 domain-containing protein [Thioalkalivibrio sp. ALE23]